MKKYMKPTVTLERFELSRNIADCAWQMTNLESTATCVGSPDTDMGIYTTMYTESNVLCNITPNLVEDYCYQAGSDGFNTYKS